MVADTVDAVGAGGHQRLVYHLFHIFHPHAQACKAAVDLFNVRFTTEAADDYTVRSSALTACAGAS